MRDLQRLEELSSTAALGLWADDVIIALDHAVTGRAGASERELLDAAATLLERAFESGPAVPPSQPSARDLATTSTTISALATLAHEQAGDQRQILEDMANALREASAGKLRDRSQDRLRRVIDFFERVAEQQLVASNSVLTSRNDAKLWTATQTMSSSS